MSQGTVFLESEADRWFERNRRALEHFDPGADVPLRLLELYGMRPKRVVELGASNGFRVAAIQERYGTRAVAVEPSRKAIDDGKRRYPAVEFHQALASATRLSEQFDLVIVHYLLHWVDRSELLDTMAAIDRLVADGGVLLMGDFYPSVPTKVRYHHLPDGAVYTYKQRYADVLLASGLYHLTVALTTEHAGGLAIAPAEVERGGVWMLRKSLSSYYAESAFPPAGPPRVG